MTDYTDPESPSNPDPASVVGEPLPTRDAWLAGELDKLTVLPPAVVTCTPEERVLLDSFWKAAQWVAAEGWRLFNPPTNTVTLHHCTDGAEVLGVTLVALSETFSDHEIAAQCQALLDHFNTPGDRSDPGLDNPQETSPHA
jgi:hypothetical protein